jgi:hypothetical protein
LNVFGCEMRGACARTRAPALRRRAQRGRTLPLHAASSLAWLPQCRRSGSLNHCRSSHGAAAAVAWPLQAYSSSGSRRPNVAAFVRRRSSPLTIASAAEPGSRLLSLRRLKDHGGSAPNSGAADHRTRCGQLREGPAPNPGRKAANPKLPQPRQDAVLERQSPVAGSETK